MGEDPAAQNQRISENIREYGWHCLHVFPTKENQDKFSYSIGFEESYGAPEVLIFGFEREKAHAVLNECAQLLKGGHTIHPDVEDAEVLAGDYTVVFKSVRPHCYGEYPGTASRYYQGKPFDAVVMVLPDWQHRFPWRSRYDGIPADEPLAII